jgi:large subunit ribosomal protein L23
MTSRTYARVLIRPVVTEKSTLQQEQAKYTFEVAPGATKFAVKEAVENAFNVKVLSVNTMRVQVRTKRFGARPVLGRTWKKAVVTLQPGNKITLFEAV